MDESAGQEHAGQAAGGGGTGGGGTGDDGTGDDGDAALLGEMRALRRQARAARHAYWFPLVLFGIVTCVSVPFYIQRALFGGSASFSDSLGSQAPMLPLLGGASGVTTQQDLGYYWLAALLAGLLLTLLWYRRNARRVGLATPALGYVLTVALLTLAALVIPPLSRVRSPHWLSWLQHLSVLWPGDLTIRGTFPFVIIAIGLWVLARAERSRALAVIAAAYTGAALLASLYDIENVLTGLGWNPVLGEWDLSSLPNVLLPALVLLAAGAGAFAVQRRQRPSGPAADESPGTAAAPRASSA